MSDVMLYGILSMPYEMAMSDELSRFQFYKTVQRLLEKDSQQQAEIEALKKHNEELQKACIESLVWVMGNGVYCSLDIEVILKNVLGSEWKDYK